MNIPGSQKYRYPPQAITSPEEPGIRLGEQITCEDKNQNSNYLRVPCVSYVRLGLMMRDLVYMLAVSERRFLGVH